MNTQICRACGAEKDLAQFYKDKGYASGIKKACIPCYKAKVREKYAANLEESRIRSRKNTLLWQQKYPEKVNSKTMRRVAKLLGRFIEDIDILVLGDRDSWICQLCFTPVDRHKIGRTPKSRSVDHKVPLSRGGEHSYNNTQLAHFGCNARKNAKLAE